MTKHPISNASPHSFRHGVATMLLGLLLAVVPVYPLTIPSIYRCTALRIMQRKGGRTYSKGYQVEGLYITFSSSNVSISGIHSGITICKKLGIRRIMADTVFLEDPEEVTVRHDDLKLYFSQDTLMGNVNIFESNTKNIQIKALIKKIRVIPDKTLRERCR